MFRDNSQPFAIQGRLRFCFLVAFIAISTGCASANRDPEGLVRAQGQDFDTSSPNRSPYSPCWYGNYFGPGNTGYDAAPIDALDAAAREHDLAYDQYGAAGPKGALTCIKVGRADLKLASDAIKAWPEIPLKGKVLSVATALTFGPLGLTKIAALGVVTVVHRWEDKIERKPSLDIERVPSSSPDVPSM
ncbi:MAG: hypothetical protein ACJ8FY_10080 [Gemmataceae bacterium]